MTLLHYSYSVVILYNLLTNILVTRNGEYSSVVERNLAKVDVARSSRVTRSQKDFRIYYLN